MNGKIVRLFVEKHFGFIKGDDGPDYFFHRSQTGANFDGLAIGDRVEFEVEDSSKGPRAVQVELE